MASAGGSESKLTLREWCAEFGVGAVTFLQHSTGLTYAAVHRIVRGRAMPRPANAQKISRATKGRVTAASILGVDDSKAA